MPTSEVKDIIYKSTVLYLFVGVVLRIFPGFDTTLYVELSTLQV
jgi:hypothetical protein